MHQAAIDKSANVVRKLKNPIERSKMSTLRSLRMHHQLTSRLSMRTIVPGYKHCADSSEQHDIAIRATPAVGKHHRSSSTFMSSSTPFALGTLPLSRSCYYNP
jgi:hypothetical protein